MSRNAVKALGSLKAKIVIDCMNPLAMQSGKLGLDRGFNSSGAETLASWIPEARIVKTLNQVGAEMMADNAGLPHRPVMFMAGNLVALSNPEGLAERLLAYERDLTRQSHAVVS